jgi:hypothetical protein
MVLLVMVEGTLERAQNSDPRLRNAISYTNIFMMGLESSGWELQLCGLCNFFGILDIL